MPMLEQENNQIRRFQCNKCQKSKLILKKMVDQQHHGFACEECWTSVNKYNRYSGCQIG